MLVPETNVLLPEQDGHQSTDILVKVISPEGVTFVAYFSGDTLIEEVKNKALDHFYPNGLSGSSRFKIVRVIETTTLHDFFTLDQEEVLSYEELLLVERRVPDASTLWNIGSLRSPHYNSILAATADLPPPHNSMRQPNLQSLLSTNELSFELRKILISLIEAGARLAAASNNYETALNQLTAALEEPKPTVNQSEVTAEGFNVEELASKFNVEEERNYTEVTYSKNRNGDDTFGRAECLQQFLNKFREWRFKFVDPPNSEAAVVLRDLGFPEEEVNRALRNTGNSMSAAASYLIGERGSSVFEILHGLPDGYILQTLLKQPQIQRGLLNTRMLKAFISMVGKSSSSTLWMNSPHGNPLLSHISKTYHSEKYCMAVNQFSKLEEPPVPVPAVTTSEAGPSTSSSQ